MTFSFYKSVSNMGLVTLVMAGFTFAQDASDRESADAAATAPASAEDTRADSSYTFGYQMGQQLKGYGIEAGDVDSESLLKGFSAGVEGEEPGISKERVQAAMEAVAGMVQEREEALGAKNLEAGKNFLEQNGKREGVVTNESGLQYEVLEKGGEEKYVVPKEGEPSKLFMVNYTGSLIDGTEFEASPEGSPVPMNLNVFPGIKEALTSMSIGAKWKLFIPSELAYGSERRSPEISPNSVLIFELELVEIKDAPAATEGGGFPVPGGE